MAEREKGHERHKRCSGHGRYGETLEHGRHGGHRGGHKGDNNVILYNVARIVYIPKYCNGI